ncbi:gamma-aminobutyric acid receptor subunit alpha-2-like isoform X2 [Periplaneta americana]|uniref:gamma-aminobutyric acid receptor subunit alpha-2-like isoform X2 n=1 Tax=Periplaneta americana TaxID=6978 RepID=UPI0037E7D402
MQTAPYSEIIATCQRISRQPSISCSIEVVTTNESDRILAYYVMDCYFRQNWYDRRLVFNFPGLDEFSLSWLFLDRVWKPDTFFMNGKKSYLHRITVPNKFLRLRNDGFLTYSMRLTVKASCPMHLRKFPLDSQSCPLLIGSYGYRISDVIYEWDETAVKVEKNVELSQYELVKISIANCPRFVRGVEEFSMIKADFHMRRNIGYFVLQLYVPCGLIVCCSWVSFWIDPDAVPARVSLGVTTVLSMTTMGFGGRAQMPRVSYATALDSFVIICFSFVFAVMIEYAAINFIDKITADLKKILQDRGVKKKSPPKTGPDAADLPVDQQPRSVSMINISSPSPIYQEIGEAASDKDGHLKAPDGRDRRRSLVSLAAPIIDSLKRNIERRKSEISLHLPAIPLLTQRRKSEASLSRPPPIPLITVTGNDSDVEAQTQDERKGSEREDDVADICCDEVFQEDGEEPEDNDEKDPGFMLIALALVIKCVMKPWKMWKHTRCVPDEDDVSRLIITGETPDKFSKIDIEARKYFPVAFCILITSYWIAYLYYITDDFPVKDVNRMLMKSKCISGSIGFKEKFISQNDDTWAV